jgi:hypothetical protein
MRTLILGVLFVVVLALALVSQLPAAMLLERGGLRDRNVEWAAVSGTIWDARVTGLSAARQPIGEVSARLEPARLLSRQIAHKVSVSGRVMQASAQTRLALDHVGAANLHAQIQIAELYSLIPELRAIGGTVTVRDGALRVAGGRCVEASGEVSTDVIPRAAERFGRVFPPLAGALSCQDGMLRADLASIAETGERVDVEVRVSLQGAAELIARVSTEDTAFRGALGSFGFAPNGPDMIYGYRSNAVRSTP